MQQPCLDWYNLKRLVHVANATAMHGSGTQLYLINGLMIVALWVAARILLFVWLFVHIWDAQDILSTFPLYVQVSFERNPCAGAPSQAMIS